MADTPRADRLQLKAIAAALDARVLPEKLNVMLRGISTSGGIHYEDVQLLLELVLQCDRDLLESKTRKQKEDMRDALRRARNAMEDAIELTREAVDHLND